jgi:hypothetical protein
MSASESLRLETELICRDETDTFYSKQAQSEWRHKPLFTTSDAFFESSYMPRDGQGFLPTQIPQSGKARTLELRRMKQVRTDYNRSRE